MFKKQVLEAEIHFDKYLSKTVNNDAKLVNPENALNAEVGIQNEDIDILCDDLGNFNEEDIQALCSYLDQDLNKKPLPKKQKKKRNNGNLKLKRKSDINQVENSDSDTPLSDLSLKDDGTICSMPENDEKKVSKKSITDKQNGQSKNKQLSERKRVILTCETILKDTTACPFRHHKSWFQCFFCTKDFMEINTLRQHTITNHQNINEEIKKLKRFPRSLQIEISNLKCRHCDIGLTDVNSLRDHFVDLHEKILYKECIADYKVNCSPYSCHLCERQFHVFRTLTTHLNEHYANCICDVCGKSFLNSKRLKVHKQTHEHGNYPCNECGKVLKTKTSKSNHMESAHSNRVLKCQICLEPMKHYNDRVKHMSVAHNITHKFKCPICAREYNIKHYLATHIRQTHGHKNKKCAQCGMAFITNHGLKKHMLKHSGIKAHSCSICCKTYARSYTLREHILRAHVSEAFVSDEIALE